MKWNNFSKNYVENGFYFFITYIRRNRMLSNGQVIAAFLLLTSSCNAWSEKLEEKVLAFIGYERSYYSKDIKTLSLMVDDNFVFTSTIDYLGSMTDSNTLDKRQLFEHFKKQPDAYPAPSIDGKIFVENNDTGYCVETKNVDSNDDNTGIEEVVTRKVCFSSKNKVLSHLIQNFYIYESKK